jgi:hypothetical protein
MFLFFLEGEGIFRQIISLCIIVYFILLAYASHPQRDE